MRRHVLLLAAAAALAGCGYVGDTMPPALNVAKRVVDLRAIEYGDRVLIDFTIPEKTTEDLVIRNIGEVDLRIGPGGSPFDLDHWAAGAKKVTVAAKSTGAVQATVLVSDWVGREVVIGVRVVNRKGRASDWSNLVVARVAQPVAKPADVKAEADPAGVRLAWTSTAPKFRVYRRVTATEPKPSMLEAGDGTSYVDKTAEYGKSYEYLVQVMDGAAESEVTEPIPITPKDSFAPAVPAGLSGVPAAGSIELVWERNTEPDLRGYRVYRAVEGGAFERVADMLDAPTYSDRKVEAGKKYRYQISSLDLSGNESAQSAAIEVAAQ